MHHGGSRVGNWAEAEMDLAEFQRRRANGELLLTKLHAKMEAACMPTPLSRAHDDGLLRFGDTISLHSVLNGTALAVNMDKQLVSEQVAYQVCGTAELTPVGRTAFTVLRPGGGDAAVDGGIVTYAEPVVLSLRSHKGASDLMLHTQKLVLPNLTKSGASKKDDVCAVIVESKATLWKFIAAEAREQLVHEQQPVRVHTAVGVQHVQTHLLLSSDLVKLRNIFGVEAEVHAQLSRRCSLTDLALPKVYLDRFVPHTSQWVVCTHGYTPPPPPAPAPIAVAAPREDAYGAASSSLAQRSAYHPSSSLAQRSAYHPPQPQRAHDEESASTRPDTTLDAALEFVRPFPFYARLVRDALAATGVRAQAVALAPVRFGPRNDIPGVLGGPVGAPAVIVLQEWWGLTPQVLAHAAALCASGYRVLVPDLYKGKIGVTAEEAHHLMAALDFGAALDELAHGAEHLVAEGAPSVGAIGFCMGGALALGAAAHCARIACAVTCYGINDALFSPAQLSAKPVQGHFGEEDAMGGFSDAASARALQLSLREAGNANAHMHIYPRAGHAFLNDAPLPFGSWEERHAAMGLPPFDEHNAHDAWQRIVRFFADHLPR